MIFKIKIEWSKSEFSQSLSTIFGGVHFMACKSAMHNLPYVRNNGAWSYRQLLCGPADPMLMSRSPGSERGEELHMLLGELLYIVLL